MTSRLMILTALAAAAVLAAAGPAVAAQEREARAAADAARSTKSGDVRAAMRKVRALGVPSVRTAIVAPGRRESYTTGVRRLGRPAAARIGDRMRIGSVTKMFTAVAIMRLVEQGRLRLEDPVETVLPGVVPNGEAITIEHLLGMRSGLASYNVQPAFARQASERPRRSWQPQELLAFAFSQPPEFAPGERVDYSNTNTIVLGLVVEALTGQTYEEAVRDLVTGPLGLRRTEIARDGRLAQPRVDGYVFEGRKRLNATSWSPTWGWAAGGGISTPPEAGRFIRALMSGRLLTPESVTTMLKRSGDLAFPPGSPFPPTRYGLGLTRTQTRCGPLYGHGGEISGYRTWVLALRDGRGSVVVSAAIGARVDGELPAAVERAVNEVLDVAGCRLRGR